MRSRDGLAKTGTLFPVVRPPTGASPIVSPPQLDPHRWSVPEPLRRGLAPLDDDTRALLRAWRAGPMARDRWRPRLALAVALLHGLFAAVLWWEMRPHPVRTMVQVQLDDALQVRFVQATRMVASTPLPAPPSLPRTPAPRLRLPVRHAMVASVHVSPVASPHAPLQLFDRTGQPLLPATSASVAATPGYVQRMPQGDMQVMQHDNPIRYHATRFEQAFPSPHETIVGEGIRGLLRKTHTGQSKSVDLGHGIHLKCKTLLGIPTPDCVMPPAPPSRKDGDERLNMAPAAPLAKELAQPQHNLADCIARYRDGKPLPQGCPVDTPTRAVDAECGEARQAGKPLPEHCPKP